jgi:hypothetical protein
MIQPTPSRLSQLYETDETAWLEAMAELLRLGQRENLDFAHLSEYLSDMARRDRREVKSRLTTLVAHILKWVHQPERRSGSWRATIIVQKQELAELLTSGVLRNHAEEIFPDTYTEAVERAAAETGLSADSFPATCAYSLEQVLAPDFFSESSE